MNRPRDPPHRHKARDHDEQQGGERKPQQRAIQPSHQIEWLRHTQHGRPAVTFEGNRAIQRLHTGRAALTHGEPRAARERRFDFVPVAMVLHGRGVCT